MNLHNLALIGGYCAIGFGLAFAAAITIGLCVESYCTSRHRRYMAQEHARMDALIKDAATRVIGEAHGCYVEPEGVKILRQAFVARRKSRVDAEIEAMLGKVVDRGDGK